MEHNNSVMNVIINHDFTSASLAKRQTCKFNASNTVLLTWAGQVTNLLYCRVHLLGYYLLISAPKNYIYRKFDTYTDTCYNWSSLKHYHVLATSKHVLAKSTYRLTGCFTYPRNCGGTRMALGKAVYRTSPTEFIPTHRAKSLLADYRWFVNVSSAANSSSSAQQLKNSTTLPPSACVTAVTSTELNSNKIELN